jgi:hypothetical protein
MLATWWHTMKSLKPIDCLILSNERSFSEGMYFLMRNLLALSGWMYPLDYYRMIALISSLTLFPMFHFSVLCLDTRTLFLFWLGCQLSIQLVIQFLSWSVCHLLQLKLFQLLIDLLGWTSVHISLVYPYGILRHLNMLFLMSMMFLQADKLIVKSNVSALLWWLVCLKLVITLPTQIPKDNLNGRRICILKWNICWRITPKF